MRILIEMLLVIAVAIPLLLIFFQHRLIYFPRSYDPLEVRVLPKTVQRIPFQTAEGAQVAYWLPPKSRPVAPAARLWVVFPGNAMLALEWLGVLGSAPLPNDGFLLIDYPGYGECAGSPSPRSIEESAQAALAAVRKAIGETARPVPLGILGVSLGAAAGLQLATHEPVDKIVLIAPFASTLEEARRTVGTPLCYLLRHRFDNVSRLRELAARPSPPLVRIFHGTDDLTIPPTRSRALKAAFPAMITLTEIEGADHNSALDMARHEIFAAMRE